MYGGSNIGGAVKYVSKAPSTEAMGGRLKVLAGEQGIWDIEGDINIPLSDKWALRAFAFTREDDGFMTNPGSLSPVFGVDYNQPEDVGAYEQSGGRLVLHGEVNDRISITASARFNEYDGPVNNWARDMGAAGSLQYPLTLDTSLNPTHERETFGARFEINVEGDVFDFKSITSYTDTESDRHTDIDLTQLWFINTFRPETMEVMTQEFRFSSSSEGPLQWVGGVYLMDLEETMNSYFDLGWIAIDGDDPLTGLQVPFETRRENKSNLAAFGNVTYETGAWEWGVGLRIDRWESEEEALDIGHSASKDDVEVLPKLSLTRRFNNDSMAYATISKGFEPGGWVGIADGAPPVYGPNGEKTLAGFDPEEAIQYELGWKGSLADGRVQATAAVFFIDYDNRQFEFIIPNPSGDGTLIDGIENIGDSEQTGIELGLTWQASDYLQISAAYGYIDAEWDSNTMLPDGSANIGGQTPPQIIEHSTSVNANFQMPAFANFDLIANFQLSHNGTMEGGKPSGGTVENPEFTVVNMQMGLASDNWELMLNLDNAFDERYYTDIEPFPKDGTQEEIDNWTANEIFWSQTIDYVNGLENMLFYSAIYGIILFFIGLISIPVLWSGNRDLGLKITSIWFVIYVISQIHLISMLYLDVGFYPDYDFGAEAGGRSIPNFIESISLLVSIVQILFCNTILFAFLALVYSKTKTRANFDIPSGFHKSPPSQD